MNPEEAFIGALLIDPNQVGPASVDLALDDLQGLVPRAVYRSMVDLWRRGTIPDLVTVMDDLTQRGLAEGLQNGATLLSMQAETPSTNYRRYVAPILDASLRHRLGLAASDVVKVAADRSLTATDAYERAKETLDSIDNPRLGTDDSVGIAEFVAGEDTFDWLVPGLVERGDRVIVVAGESGGKSTLLRQMAMCCAFGIHPFRHGGGTPMRVALLDFENPESLVRRKVRPLYHQARIQRPQTDPVLRVVCRPGGLDINRRVDARWLSAQLTTIRPDLVVAGPLYKMFSSDNEGWESGAAKAAAVMDDLRTRLNFGLVLETHPPQEYGGSRSLRPFGSSLWRRWPEFGLAFAVMDKHPNTVKVTMWKDRDERHWPRYLKRGGDWPWTSCGDPEGPKGVPDPAEWAPPPGPNFEQGEF